MEAEKRAGRHGSAVPAELSNESAQFDRSSFFLLAKKVMGDQIRVAVTSRYSALMLVVPSVA